jgi:hypothetical protein
VCGNGSRFYDTFCGRLQKWQVHVDINQVMDLGGKIIRNILLAMSNSKTLHDDPPGNSETTREPFAAIGGMSYVPIPLRKRRIVIETSKFS